MRSPQRQFRLALSATLLTLTLIPATVARAAETEQVIASFTGSGGANVGAAPFTPNLVRDSSGNLFGAVSGGGNPNCISLYQHYCGVIFELTPIQGGGWSETVLYIFQGGADGSAAGTPVLDRAGNLYSFTNDGGSKGYGTIFELSPNRGGLWKKKVLHNFAAGPTGATPGHMISDAAGNLYGTTGQGGNSKCSLGVLPLGCGIVFNLSRNGHGGWTERVLSLSETIATAYSRET